MATAQKQQDTRKPNFQPNHLPESIGLAVGLAGEAIGAIGMVQNAKLSAKGNITFGATIREGWMLPGTWMDTLKLLSFDVNDVKLSMAASGVHQSEAGNPTVCFTGVVDVPNTGGEPVRYMVQVYATWLVKKGSYNLKATAFPQAITAAGEQIVGTVSGLTIAERNTGEIVGLAATVEASVTEASK